MDTAVLHPNAQITFMPEDNSSEQQYSYHPSLLASLNQQLRTSLKTPAKISEGEWPERITNVFSENVKNAL